MELFVFEFTNCARGPKIIAILKLMIVPMGVEREWSFKLNPFIEPLKPSGD